MLPLRTIQFSSNSAQTICEGSVAVSPCRCQERPPEIIGGSGFHMLRSCMVFVSLALIVCTTGAVGHLYYGLSRIDAGLLTLCGLALAAIYALTLPWRARAAPAQKAAEPQAPSTAVLAYRLAD